MDIDKRIINDKLISLGLTFSQCAIEPQKVLIESSSMLLNLSGSFYILVSREFDLPERGCVHIMSEDNSFKESVTQFRHLQAERYQPFQNYMEVIVSNVGSAFIPFELEFLKVTPFHKKK